MNSATMSDAATATVRIKIRRQDGPDKPSRWEEFDVPRRPNMNVISALQWIAALNPISVMVAAMRELFGNPLSPMVKHTWPLEHAVLAAFIYCGVILAIAVPASLRRYRARTSD